MPRTYTNLVYHVTFSTTMRRPLLDGPWVEELYRYAGGIVRGDSGVLDEIGGIEDHIHLVLRLRAKTAISDLIGRLKSGTSAWVNDHGHTPVRFRWQRGFAAFTVSESVVPSLRRYIQNQEQHHAALSTKDELRLLLQKSHVPFSDEHI